MKFNGLYNRARAHPLHPSKPNLSFLALLLICLIGLTALNTAISQSQETTSSMTANSLIDIGKGQLEKEDYTLALGNFLNATEVAMQDDHISDAALSFTLAGDAYVGLEQFEDALEYYLAAMYFLRQIADTSTEAVILGKRGALFNILGQPEASFETLNLADDVASLEHRSFDQASYLADVAYNYMQQGYSQGAANIYLQVIDIRKEINDRYGQGNSLGNLGIAYRKMGEYEKSFVALEEALEIALETDNLIEQRNWFNALGINHRHLEQYEEAIEYLETAIELNAELGDIEGRGSALTNLANTYVDLERYEESIGLYDEAIEIARTVNDRFREGLRIGNLGIAYLKLEEYQTAVDLLEEALAIGEEIRDTSRADYWQAYLDDALAKLNQ